MKQIWDLKGIIVSANDQIYTGKSAEVPMDIKGANLRFTFNATSDPIDNGYPVTVTSSDDSVASVTKSASDPSSFTINGKKTGYATVTAKCSIYTFDFIVYVADTSSSITLAKLKQQRADDIAKKEAEAKAKAEEEAAAKKAAEEKAAQEAAAKKAAEAKAQEEAAKSTFSPKAGDVYKLDGYNEELTRYIYFVTESEMRIVLDGGLQGYLYTFKYSSKDSKSENGICFKNTEGIPFVYLDENAYLIYENGYQGYIECDLQELFRYSIVTDKGSKTGSLYDKWKLRANDCVSDMFFSGYFTLLFSNNGRVTWTGSSYHLKGNFGELETVSKTCAFSNKDGFIKIEDFGEFSDGSGIEYHELGDFYYDGKALRYAIKIKKVSDNSLIQKIKNARLLTARDLK